MNLDPEENLLDHSLRDIFQDYDLPPGEHKHVWAGVEARISSLPKPHRGLPYRLVVPLTAVMGVAVGWLLPRPAAWQSAPTAAPVHTVAQAASAPAVAWVAQPTAQSQAFRQPQQLAGPQPLAEVAAVSGAQVAPSRPARKRTTAAQAVVAEANRAVSSPALAADNAQTEDALVVVVPASLLAMTGDDTVPATPTLLATAPVTAQSGAIAHTGNVPAAQPLATHAPKVTKEDGNNEKILYRKPTHRQPERGSAVRRWFSHLSQTLNHLL